MYVYGQVPTKRLNSNEFQSLRISKGNSKAPIKRMPSLDIKTLLKEDRNEQSSGLPPRFGKALDVNIGFGDGKWEDKETGSVWTLSIQSEGALSINLIFDQFYLPLGAELYIFNEEKNMVIGPVTEDQNNKSNVFATDILKGSSITIQLFEPIEANGQSKLHLNKVVHGYKNIIDYAGFGDSSPCNNDINCPEGNNWQEESNAVALILLDNGQRHCSGVLLNNGCMDFTPSFLTAFHCLDIASPINGSISLAEREAVENWVFRFQYKSSSCGGGDDPYSYSFSGATFRSAWRNSDFALLELNERPEADTGIQYAGWSRSPNAPPSSVSIHHPAGDVMKISVENNAGMSTNWYAGTNNTHWEVNFDDGTVEPGSSGSPLFDQNGRVVGQLHGGTSFDQYGNPVDRCIVTDGIYGRFDVSWNGGGTPDTRLSTWLTNDPSIMTTNTVSMPFIDDPGNICDYRSFIISNYPSGYETEWTVSPGLVASNTSPNFIVATIDNYTGGPLFLEALITNPDNGCSYTIRKDLRYGGVDNEIYDFYLSQGSMTKGGSAIFSAYGFSDIGEDAAINYEWETVPSISSYYTGTTGTQEENFHLEYIPTYLNYITIRMRPYGGCEFGDWKEKSYGIYNNFNYSFYPNPNQGILYISENQDSTKESSHLLKNSKESAQLTVIVFDKKGKELKEECFNTSENVTMDVSDLPKGLYYIKFFNKEFSETQILIRE